MKIEILYPDIANLFGEIGHVEFITKLFNDTEVIRTHITERPRFLIYRQCYGSSL